MSWLRQIGSKLGLVSSGAVSGSGASRQVRDLCAIDNSSSYSRLVDPFGACVLTARSSSALTSSICLLAKLLGPGSHYKQTAILPQISTGSKGAPVDSMHLSLSKYTRLLHHKQTMIDTRIQYKAHATRETCIAVTEHS